MGIVASQGAHLKIHEWIKNFLNLFKKKRKEEGSVMEIDFISTLWGIWLHRNEIIFRKSNLNPVRIMEIIKENINRARAKRSQGEIKADNAFEESHKDLQWTVGQSRSSNVQTLVVDGEWKKNTQTQQWQAAIAWKNLNNDPREEFAGKIFSNSAKQTEAYSIMKALTDMEWRCTELIIKTDNQEIIRALRNPEKNNKDTNNIIKDIRKIANSVMFVCCKKVRREEVILAHKLAVTARKS